MKKKGETVDERNTVDPIHVTDGETRVDELFGREPFQEQFLLPRALRQVMPVVAEDDE